MLLLSLAPAAAAAVLATNHQGSTLVLMALLNV
jgi:hypothetical protein